MTREEHAKVLDSILLKWARGEKLTEWEQRIKAYSLSPCRCSCGVRR